MSVSLGELAVLLTAHEASFVKSMDKAEGRLGSFNALAQKVTMAAAGLFAGGALAVSKMVDAASDAAEQMNVLGLAFGSNKDAVLAWSGQASQAMGRSKVDLLDYAGSVGSLLAPTLGVTKSTASMSTNLAQLAVDLGSVYNVAEQDSLGALRAALIGSAEPMLRFGVTMTQAALGAYALEQGITKEMKSMTEAEKIQLRYAFLMEKTSIAHGDAENTGAGWANMSKRIAGQVQDLSVQIGQALLPYAEQLAAAVSGLIGWFQGLSPEVLRFAGLALGVGTALAGVVAAAGGLGLALPLLASGLAAVGSALAAIALPAIVAVGVIAAIVTVIAVVRKAWIEDLGGMRTYVLGWINAIGTWWDALAASMAKTWRGFKDAVMETLSSIARNPAVVGFVGAVNAPLAEALLAFNEGSTEAADAFVGAFKTINDTGESVMTAMRKTTRSAASFVVDAFGDMAKDVGDALSGIKDNITETFSGKPGQGFEYAPVGTPSMSGGGGTVGYDTTQADLDAWNEQQGYNAPQPEAQGSGLSGVGQQVGQSALGKMGTAGDVLNAGMQGMATAGPIGAIIAVIAELLMKTEGFMKSMELISEQFDGLIDAIGPITASGVVLTQAMTDGLKPIFETMKNIMDKLNKSALTPLNAAFGQMFQAVMPIIEVILTLLGPILEIFGYALRGIAVIVSGISIVIAWVVNAVIDVITEIMQAVESVLDDFMDTSGMNQEIRNLKKSRLDIRGMMDTLDDIAAGRVETWEDAAEDENLPQISSDAADGIGDLGDAAGGAADSLREVGESLLNVPEGFKLARTRFGAATGSGADDFTGTATPRIGQVNIYANDARDMWEKMKGLAAEDRFLDGASVTDFAPLRVDRKGS